MIKALLSALSILALSILLAPAHAGAAKPIRIVVLGDSLTAGYGLGPEDGFTEQLQRALNAKGLDVTVVNAGVSGDTADAGLARLDWSLGDNPDAVIVELGANDMLRGFDPSVTRAALDKILAKLQAKDLPVLLAGMRAAPNLGPEFSKRFDAIYPQLASTHGAMLYPFFLDGVAADPKLLQADGMHPNADGVDIIVQHILPSVEQLIAEVPR